MDEKELRALLLERLHMELQLFKDSMLQREKEDIFVASYEIEIYVNLYEIFAVHIDSLQGEIIRRLLNLNFGILESAYLEWLTRADGFFEELKNYACSELENILEMGNVDRGKDGKDEKGLHTAA